MFKFKFALNWTILHQFDRKTKHSYKKLIRVEFILWTEFDSVCVRERHAVWMLAYRNLPLEEEPD